MADKILYANLAKSTLASGISDVATSLAVQVGHGSKFPNPPAGQYFKARIKDAGGNWEIVHCTARSVDTLTITRGQEGTVARAFAGGDNIEVVVTKETLETFTQRGVEETIDGNRILDGLLKSTNGLSAQTAINYVLLSGTNTYTGTLSPALTAYVANMRVLAKVTNANTGAVTINLNGLGAKSVKNVDGSALASGMLSANCLIEARYDGTDFILMSVSTRALPANVPRRQTVLTGAVDTNGQANFLAAGTGLAVTLNATSTAVRAAIAAGFDCLGQVDYIAQFSANQADYFSGLAASNVSYLILDRDTSTGAITAYKTLVPPQYGPTFDKTKQSLLHFEGADASTTITDEYGNTWTAGGNAQIDTAQFKHGSASALFDGAGDYVESTAITSLGSESWTMECWVRFNALPSGNSQNIITLRQSANDFGVRVRLGDSAGVKNIYFDASSNGSSFDIASGVTGTRTTWLSATWYHIAVTYDAVAGKYFVYVDGVQDVSVTSSAKIAAGAAIRLGLAADATNSMNGWIDEFRLSPCCRYPNGTTFTTSASAFTTDAEWFDTSEFKWKYGAPGSFVDKHRVCVGSATTGAASVSSVVTYGLRGRYESPITWTLPGGGVHTSISHNIGILPLEKRLRLHTRYVEYGFSQFDVTELFANNAGVITPVSTRANNTVFGFTTGVTDNALIRKDTGAAVTGLVTARYGYSVVCDRGW